MANVRMMRAAKSVATRPVIVQPSPVNANMPQVTIEARWEDGVWKVDIDRNNRNSAFACRDNLADALHLAIEMALENYIFRRDKAGESLEGPVA